MSRYHPSCRWLREWRCAAVLLSGALLSGCATGRSGTEAGIRGRISELHLLTIPVALNFDQVPGPDGFAVKVYASRPEQPKPVVISSGTLEIMMFDGLVKPAALATTNPKRTWSFSAKDLKGYERQSSIGICYQFALPWGESKPSGETITVMARYNGTDGGSVFSSASAIRLNVK